MVDLIKANWGYGLTLLFAGFTIVFGISIFVRHIDSDFFSSAFFGIGAIIAAAVMLSGLVANESRPWRGAALLSLGAVAITVLHFWMFFIYVPVTLAIIAFGALRARRSVMEKDRTVIA